MLGRLGEDELNDLIPSKETQIQWAWIKGNRFETIRGVRHGGRGHADLWSWIYHLEEYGKFFNVSLLPTSSCLHGGTPIASPGEMTAWQGWHLLVPIAWITVSAWTEPLHFLLVKPSKDPHWDGRKEAAKGKQLFSEGRSRGVLLTLWFLGATCPDAACHAKRGTEPCTTSPNGLLASPVLLLRNKEKAEERAETPTAAGEVFWGAAGGAPSFLSTCCNNLNEQFWD